MTPPSEAKEMSEKFEYWTSIKACLYEYAELLTRNNDPVEVPIRFLKLDSLRLKFDY